MFDVIIKDNNSIDTVVKNVEIISAFRDHRKSKTVMLLSGRDDISQLEIPLTSEIIIKTKG